MLPAVVAPAPGFGRADGRKEAQPASTIVSITFDDARTSQWVARTLLNRRGMRATFYVNSGTVGRKGRLSWSQLRQLEREGHEVGGHGLEHRKLTLLTKAQKRRQVCADRSNLLRRGLAAVSFAYPYAVYGWTARQIVASCGYSSARTVGGIAGGVSGETIPPRDLWAVRTANFVRRETTLAYVQDRIVRAEAAGARWVPLVFHDVCLRCDEKGYWWRPATFAALLDWLAARTANGTVVLTVRDALTETAAG